MLLKFFGSRNNSAPPNPHPNPGFREVVEGETPLFLQIIHAGGMAERYYMAFPARWIMEKYPDFVLARPEIFRRPWDSIVPPEEILVPGHKYFVVPIRTVKKLFRRKRKPSIDTITMVCKDKDTVCSKSSFLGKPKSRSNDWEDKGKKRSNRKKNVRFNPSLPMIDEGSEDH